MYMGRCTDVCVHVHACVCDRERDGLDSVILACLKFDKHRIKTRKP